MPFSVVTLSAEPETITALADLLIETVANRGSIGFMHPVSRAKAVAFWGAAMAAAERGQRVVLGAFEGGVAEGGVSDGERSVGGISEVEVPEGGESDAVELRRGVLVGTVSLLLDCPENQPHRGEIAKMMTKMSHRGMGVASALLAEAERIAVERGRTLLVLDTAEQEGAAGLYERMGYQRTGVIPDFALMPYGGLTGTIVYWKRIGAKKL
jgi:ribosomal protein S18 acetylase RimI-like enzyme